MPRLLGDPSAFLRRIDQPLDEITSGLWLLAHPDLVRTARVHAFIEHFSTALGTREFV